MTSSAADTSLEAFYAGIVERLAQPAVNSVPIQASTLYPPNQPPDLLIYIGEADAGIVRSLRSQLPASTFLFCLHPLYQPERTLATAQSVPADERTFLCPLDQKAQASDKVSLLVTVLPDRQIRMITADGIRNRFPDDVTAIERAVTTTQENAAQNRTRGLLRLRCATRNLPLIWKHSGTRPCRVPPETVAVICGAGPSLAFHLERLKSVAGRVLVVAVGHAAPTLFKAGITPDVVVETDYYAARNWPEGLRMNSLLVACTDVAPEVTPHFDNILWFDGNSTPFNITLHQWGINMMTLQMNRTVTVSAIDLAVRLGCGRIALIGQDMCIAHDGTSHVDGGHADEGDGLHPIPGNDGPPVQATQDLVLLRRSLQEYLAMLTPGKAPAVFNCTHGGAVIDGAPHLRFEDFSRGLTVHHGRTAIFDQTETAPCPASHLEELALAIESYALTSSRIMNCCARLSQFLTEQPVNMKKVRDGQSVLQQLMRQEESIRTSPVAAKWINTLLQHVDTVMKQTPGMVTNDVDPQAQLSFLSARFSFAGNLGRDVLADLNAAQKQMHGIATAYDDAHATAPYIFNSFRSQATDFIRTANPELATFLDTHRLTPPENRFRIAWKNQIIPYVRIRGTDGHWSPLSNWFSMSSEAERDIRQFMTSAGYDRTRHGLVIAAPGNWICPMTFARLNPDAELVVVEPWLDLFSALIDRGCFTHHLPRKALIVAADPRLATWKAVFKERIAVWKLRGITPLFLLPPHAAALREPQQIMEQLQAMAAPRPGMPAVDHHSR